MAETQFPNETAEYRTAREELARAERELSAGVTRVAELRRALPLGGEVPEDYAFTELGIAGEPVTRHMSELLPDGVDTLIVYNFMYSPEMARPCPMCSSVIDGLDAAATSIAPRAALAVVAKSPVERINAFARQRGWTRVRLLSWQGTSYGPDYAGEEPSGQQSAGLNVFTRTGGALHHFWASEAGLDTIWPLWNLLDMTPEGRGQSWHPGFAGKPSLSMDEVLEIVGAPQ